MERISPDSLVIWQWGFVTINATLLFTWLVMALLVVFSWLVTRKLSTGTKMSRGQNLLEVLVNGMRNQIREISRQQPDRYLPFVGTLFLFIAISNLLIIIPGYQAPTGSLSTAAALAACVLFAVPFYGITQSGLLSYLKHYVKPTPFMLPFHVIGEISRTLALAVRLFGNVMSGSMIVAVLLAITPLVIPIAMQALGLLTGLIQAYIFAILAMVYIASGTRTFEERERKSKEKELAVKENSENS